MNGNGYQVNLLKLACRNQATLFLAGFGYLGPLWSLERHRHNKRADELIVRIKPRHPKLLQTVCVMYVALCRPFII